MNDFYQKTSYHLKIMGGGVLTTALGVLIFLILLFIPIITEIFTESGLPTLPTLPTPTILTTRDVVNFIFGAFFFSFINAIIPVIFLFYLFIFILEKDKKEKIKTKHSGFIGMALGLTFVLIIGLAGFFLVGYRIAWEVLLRMLFNGLVSSLLPGYLAGNYCYKLVKGD
jgi:hypothetical protein